MGSRGSRGALRLPPPPPHDPCKSDPHRQSYAVGEKSLALFSRGTPRLGGPHPQLKDPLQGRRSVEILDSLDDESASSQGTESRDVPTWCACVM